MHAAVRSLLLRPGLLLNGIHAFSDERRRRRQRKWTERNMQRIDTRAFPMLRDVAHPPSGAPAPDRDERE